MVEFALLIVWLALGGWAFAYWVSKTGDDEKPLPAEAGLFLGLAFAAMGPFMAGAAFYSIRKTKRKELAEEGK